MAMNVRLLQPRHPADDEQPPLWVERRADSSVASSDKEQGPSSSKSEPSSVSSRSEEPKSDVLNLFCAWSIGFLTAIEGTVSTPSLWLYCQSLGGSKSYYTTCIMAFPMGRLAMMGIFGMWTDMRPYKEVFVISLLISMSSGVLYASGPTLGMWVLPVARAVLGAMSCQSVATQAFVSQNTAPSERTKYMSINNVVTSSLNICGPAFNFILVALPNFEISIGISKVVFNSFTWVGWFLFLIQLLCMLFILFCFTEPAKRVERGRSTQIKGIGRCLTLGGLFPWGRIASDPWLYLTKAWVCFGLNFRNQFTNFAVTWIIPVISDRDYGFGQFENSLIFVGLALETVIASLLVGYVSKWINDRDSLCYFQFISFTGLLVYIGLSHGGTQALPLPLFVSILMWYDFGAPASQTQSLYSKMIGPGAQGTYFSVLQSNGAVGRLVAAQTTRAALSYYGMPCLWGTVMGLWVVQWFMFFAYWNDLHPTSIEEMHERLSAEHPEMQAKGKGKGKGQIAIA